MRTILKIIAAPFVVLLTILWAVLVFVCNLAGKLLGIASGIAGLCAIVMLIAGQTAGGITLAVIAFLVSPVGIPAIAEWLIDKLGDLNGALKSFITN